MEEVSMERHGHAKQLVVFFGAAGIGTRGGWGPTQQPAASEPGPSTPLPAKGKEYPGLGYKRLRDKPVKTHPAVAQ
ncbi:hypothetical protein HaLaN_22502 [Haematococcus lacustris]|uniref:Uncharacterized protein n=1 Tax=Haematococcus lacustris TaxID=44745 RepID=A0A6A0A0A6_HAELA|nr:hypothetical protein HaLaN_22502 [Haematococcus lacustris]